MTSKELITQLYIGYFDRAPDPAGLNFWIGVLDGGLSLDAIAQDFATQAEALATYPFLNNDPADNVVANIEAFITAIYENLFDRVPEPEGLTFWTGVLQGEFPVGTFILAIIEGASEADATVLANKTEVACAWVQAAEAEDGFVLDDAYIDGSATALGDVTSDPATVDAGKAAADLFFQEGPSVALANTAITLPEDTDLSSRLKVADIVVTDDDLGTNVLSLSGDDAALFEVDGTELFLKAGSALDFETNPVLDVNVEVDDAAFGGSPDGTAALSISLGDVNEAPSVTLENLLAGVDENADTTGPIKVADIVVSDDGLGTKTLQLSGDDAALFKIDGTGLFLKAGSAFDFETNPSLDVNVEVDDPAVGATPDDIASMSVAVTDVNEAPSVSLTNALTSVAEDLDTAIRVKVADILVTDDVLGSNTLTLGGTDAALFEIDGSELFLKSGTVLDFETVPSLDVTVLVDDASVGASPDDTAELSLQVTDVNEAPSIDVTLTVTTLAEDADTSADIKVADILLSDDALGSNTLALAGADAGLFVIYGSELFLKAGTALDFETNPSLDVSVTVEDADVGTNPDDTVPLSIVVTDVNEAPSVVLSGTTTTLSETADTTSRIKVADIVLSDDGLGTNILALTGSDAAFFEIVGTELFLKAGSVLDFETNPSLDVSVTVEDAGVGANPDDTAELSIAVTDVNEAPTVAVSGIPVSLSESTDTAARVKVGDITITDDGIGTNTLSLSGADAALFEIDGSELFLKAGTVLDFETNPNLDVSVLVDDTGIGTGVEDTALVSIAVTDANEAPTVELASALAALAEDTSIAARIKVADIIVSDDAIGTNTLSLSGADAALFEIDGAELFLKAGTVLDFETNPNLDVSVSVDDASIGATPDDSAALSIAVTDVNEAPTVALLGAPDAIFEGLNTTSRIEVATISISDDGTGTNALGLSGVDASLFEIDGNTLFLKAGAALNAVSNPVLDVSVTVDDVTIGGTPDDTADLSIAVKPGAAGAVADHTEALTFTGGAASEIHFGQIEVADADPDTAGDQPGFIFNLDNDGIPYAGVAGAALSLIDATGHDGLVDLGVVAVIDNEDFTLTNLGSTGTVIACLGEANVFGDILGPELSSTGTWSFIGVAASDDFDLTLKDGIAFNAGGTLNLTDVETVVAGDVDLSVLGAGLVVSGGSLEVADDGCLTISVEQAIALDGAGIVVTGSGTLKVVGNADDAADFGTVLGTAFVDLSGVVLTAADANDRFDVTFDGNAIDDAGDPVAQNIIGTAFDDTIAVSGAIDYTVTAGDDTGDIGAPNDTRLGTPDPTESDGDVIDTSVMAGGAVTVVADAGYDRVTLLTDSDVVQIVSGAEFYAELLGDFTATAQTTNDGVGVLEANDDGEDIDMSLAGGANGWSLIGAPDAAANVLIGSDQADYNTLVDGLADTASNLAEEDTFTGNDGDDRFLFNIATSETATATITSVIEATDRLEITVDSAFADDDIVRFTFDIGSETFNVTLQDDIDGVDLESTSGVADALADALDGLNGVSASASGSVVDIFNNTDGNSVAPDDADGGAEVDFSAATLDPNGTPSDVSGQFTPDELMDADFSSDPDAGDDDRLELTIALSGTVVVGETYAVSITPDDGAPSTVTVIATTTSLQDLTDAIADNIDAAFSATAVAASSIGGGDTVIAAGVNELQTATTNAAIPANTIVLWVDSSGIDVNGFEITAFGSTPIVSALSSSSILLGGETTLAETDADVITDFVSGEDSIDFDLLDAGDSSNYGEAAEVADFGTALTDATASMTSEDDIYYLTSTAADGGLLFYDANGDGTADGVVSLTGISSSNFDDSDIV